MKHFVFLAALIAAMASLCPAAPCSTGTLASYIALGASGCSIAGSTFSSFQTPSDSTGATPISPQNITISPLTSGGPGLSISTNASAPANAILEVRFAYQISGASYTASAIGLSNASASGDGAVTEIQDYCLGGQFGSNDFSGCTGAADNQLLFGAGTTQNTFAAVSSINVVNDLTMDGGTMGSASGATVTNQLTATGSGPGGGSGPFGSFDTPLDNSTVNGAVNVTGWALSTAGIQSVAVSREPVTGESSSGLVFIVNPTIVPGARPDVASTYPGYPNNNSGWGAQILTNELPNSNGTPGVGNGTYRLHAIVTDNAGQTTDLGVRTITANNSQSALPFGTIDTPAQGATASGSAYVNFGWAVTPLVSSVIPKDGSTIVVYIDNLPVGHPVYNNFRQDIATIFPGLQNSNGAVGYYMLDTTKLSNGLHTIAWTVTDSAGRAAGIGSRLFNVQN